VQLFRTLIVLFSVALVTTVSALNPQPEPPGFTLILNNGVHATVVKNQLLLPVKGKHHPAPAGQYLTREGIKLVVKADGRLDAATLRQLKNPPPKPK
jgi:hypothetical protein